MTQKKAFPLRINEEIWQALRRWSDDELRSVNGQIEYLLRDALRKAGRMPMAFRRTKIRPGKSKFLCESLSVLLLVSVKFCRQGTF